MKKLSILMALVMLCSVFAFSAFAAEDAVASINSVTATAGGTVTMTVALTNSPAITGLSLSIGYDSNVMSFVSAKSLNSHFNAFYPSTQQGANPVKLVMANLSLAEVSGNVSVAEITFKMADKVTDGRYTVSLTVEEAYNKNIEAVSLKAENGVITVGTPAETTIELKMTVGKTTYTLNGEQKTMDVAPLIINSRTMLPVRYVAEALGAEIGWDGATSTATLKTADTEIKITVGAAEAIVNGQAVKLDSPAVIEKDRSFMPVRFVAETLGGTVAWDGATSTATITK